MAHKNRPKEPIDAWQFYHGLQEFLAEFERIRALLRDAKGHILTNVKAFPPSELECLVRDGVLSSDELPEELRTNAVKGCVQHAPPNVLDLSAKIRRKR